MKVLKVNNSFSIDFNHNEDFKLYPDDILFTDDDFYIYKIGYYLQELPNIKVKDLKFLDVEKSNVGRHIRVNRDYLPIERLIGGMLSDITVKYNREKSLKEILE